MRRALVANEVRSLVRWVIRRYELPVRGQISRPVVRQCPIGWSAWVFVGEVAVLVVCGRDTAGGELLEQIFNQLVA